MPTLNQIFVMNDSCNAVCNGFHLLILTNADSLLRSDGEWLCLCCGLWRDSSELTWPGLGPDERGWAHDTRASSQSQSQLTIEWANMVTMATSDKTESNILPGVLLCTPETRVIYARSYFSQLRWTSKWIIMTRHDSNHLLARANCQCQCTILFWS